MVMPPTLSAVGKLSSRATAQRPISADYFVAAALAILAHDLIQKPVPTFWDHALLRLEDAVKLKTVAVVDQLQARGVGIGRLVLGEQNVEIIELCPIQPERRHPGQRAVGGDDELRDRGRRAV